MVDKPAQCYNCGGEAQLAVVHGDAATPLCKVCAMELAYKILDLVEEGDVYVRRLS